MRALALFLLLLPGFAKAQFVYELDHTIPVTGEGSVTLKYPWGGGLNAIQVNTMDINGDELEDLVLFERMGDLVLTYIREDDAFIYAPQYEVLFPEGITNWLLLRDFNNDGRKDIFTGDALGAKVYVNKTQAGQPITWQPFLFFSGTDKTNLLLTKGTTSKSPMQLSYDDLPSISDADGDGDLDMFIMKYQESSIEYHRNYSKERYNSLDSLDFERAPPAGTAWGGVRECSCGEFAFNDAVCSTSGRENHAGGKSLFALDVDNDGDLDMLFAEAECDQLFLLENTSNDTEPNNAVIASAVPYPGTFSMVNFPAPYREDLDFDGIPDLIVSPNLFFREFDESNFKQSVWFYKNSGTNTEPVFSTVNKTFLQGDMIDVGDNAVPAFFDIDNDGDQDMFIGCYINVDEEAASIYFYENTGTSSEPEFTFVTDDYRALTSRDQVNMKPMFADMNGDGKKDMVFTAQSKTFPYAAQLYYIINTGTTQADFSGSVITAGFTLLWREENIAIADVNEDGLPDLIVGKLNGALDYWKNTGTTSTPAFTLQQANYLNLSSTVLRQSPAVATGDLNNDGKDDLIYGDQTGKITLISNYRETEDASASKTEIVYNALIDQYVAQNLGGRIWPVIASLFGYGKPEIITGNILGGIHILKNRYPTTSIPEETAGPIISVYPNPVSGSQLASFTIEVNAPAQVQLLNALGQPVSQSIAIPAAQRVNPQLPEGLKGMYLLHFVVRGKSYTRKIVIR